MLVNCTIKSSCDFLKFLLERLILKDKLQNIVTCHYRGIEWVQDPVCVNSQKNWESNVVSTVQSRLGNIILSSSQHCDWTCKSRLQKIILRNLDTTGTDTTFQATTVFILKTRNTLDCYQSNAYSILLAHYFLVYSSKAADLSFLSHHTALIS